MIPISALSVSPLWRPGRESRHHVYATARSSWDFVVDGNSLAAVWENRDVVGVLGWADTDSERLSVRRLLREAQPDFLPNRVALFVCPECGDLGCGAVTVAIDCQAGSVTWSDFRWEVNWADPGDPDAFTERFNIGPFRFEYQQYADALRHAQSHHPPAGSREAG